MRGNIYLIRDRLQSFGGFVLRRAVGARQPQRVTIGSVSRAGFDAGRPGSACPVSGAGACPWLYGVNGISRNEGPWVCASCWPRSAPLIRVIFCAWAGDAMAARKRPPTTLTGASDIGKLVHIVAWRLLTRVWSSRRRAFFPKKTRRECRVVALHAHANAGLRENGPVPAATRQSYRC